MRMWTVQTEAVDEVINRDGVSYVKLAYIRRKYGETAWIFLTAYDFLIREMEKRIPRPREAESPVWVFRESGRAGGSAGDILYELEIPEEELLLFDLRDWQDILSLRPLGTEEERKAILQEAERQGAGDISDAFSSPFYPLLRKRTRDSWKALLEDPVPEKAWQQGAVWQLKREWIVRRQVV